MNVLWVVLAASSTWSLVEKKDGIELYEKELPGERLVALKAVTVSKLPVAALCSAAYGDGKIDKAETEVKLRKLISNENGVRITYEQVSAPVVSDRDFAVKAVKEELPGGGCTARFEVANEHAPPLPKDFVRMEKMRATWTFEPLPDGNVVCTYNVFADPGGMIPAMLIEGSRKKSAIKWVKLVLDRATPLATAAR